MGRHLVSLRTSAGKVKAGASALARRPIIRLRLRRVQRLVNDGMLPEMRAALEYLVTGREDPTARTIAERAEGRRTEIANGVGTIPVWSSPRPGDHSEKAAKGLRPEPGEVKDFSMAKVATLGKHRKWGVTLYLLAREFGCTFGVELGACAGISGMYVASAPTMATFITVEGSTPLSEIARQSLDPFPGASVVNSLFDDALDSLLPRLVGRVDFAFVDGHHEKLATIHYVDRLRPALKHGALVVFDDISWSFDMRQAWDLLRVGNQWSYAIDLGEFGICIYRDQSSPTAPTLHWELHTIVGRRPITGSDGPS